MMQEAKSKDKNRLIWILTDTFVQNNLGNILFWRDEQFLVWIRRLLDDAFEREALGKLMLFDGRGDFALILLALPFATGTSGFTVDSGGDWFH
jgi:hypothetical protein